MRTRLAVALAATTALVVAARPARAQNPTWRQGYVTKNSDGRKIEGRILDRGDRIVLDKGHGVQIDFDPSEVKVTYTDAAPDPNAATSGRRFVELELKDGSVIRGEILDEKGGQLTIRPRSRGKDLPNVVVKQSDVVKTTTLPDLGAGEGSSDESSDRYVDWDGRFVYERVGQDWVLRKSTSPEVRIKATLGDRDAFLTIAVRPLANLAAGSPWLDPTGDGARKIQVEVEAELRAELDRPGSLSIAVGQLFGAPIYECKFEGCYPGEQTVYQFLDARFVRDGLLYVLRVGAEKKEVWKTVEPQLREAWTGFSFLSTYAMDDASYNDLAKGFGIDRPSPKWSLDARPFEDKLPLVMKNEDGRAEILVRIVETSSDAAPYLNDYLKNLEADRKKAGFALLDRKNGKRGAQSVETYHCEYYEAGASRKRDFEGVVAKLDKGIVHVEGIAPLSDVDAKQIQAEVMKALDALRFFDARASRKRLLESSQAVSELGKALDALKKKAFPEAAASASEAIKLYDDYARAWFVLAQSNVELKKWREYREALDKALALDPRPELEARAVALYKQEVDIRVKDKQYGDAVRAWKDVIRANSKDEKMRKDFLRFYTDWWNELKRSTKPEKIKDAIDEIEDAKWSDKAFDDLLATFYVEAGDTLLRADKKQWSKAKQMASRAISLDRDNPKAKDLIKSCDDARKSLENASKKK